MPSSNPATCAYCQGELLQSLRSLKELKLLNTQKVLARKCKPSRTFQKHATTAEIRLVPISVKNDIVLRAADGGHVVTSLSKDAVPLPSLYQKPCTKSQ